MRLRIISGSLKGRYVDLSGKDGLFRPTLERTRQSVAEILKMRIVDAATADVCAGSGAFGFEMLSRGAQHVDFVENDRKRMVALRDNARILGVSEQCGFCSGGVADFIRNGKSGYDIIYFDPPYEDLMLNGMVFELGKLLAHDGVLAYEHRRTVRVKQTGSELALFDSRSFGDTIVDFYMFDTGKTTE